MLALTTFVVFLAVAVTTALVFLRFWAWRVRAVDRLALPSKSVTPFIPSPSLIWHEIVQRVGSFVPASSKDLPILKRRLIRAGFRNPSSSRVFRGVRMVSLVVFTLAGFAFGIRSYVSLQNLLMVIGAAGMLGYMAPMQYLKFKIARRKRGIEKGLPNALDLMVVCVESGLGLDQTTVQVAKELQFAYPEICEEFTVMNLEMRAGKRRAEALHNLAERTGVEELKKLVAVLIQTDRFGTSIAQSLRGHSDYMRVMARQKAEEQAAKLAVKLVFPIFFCILPSLFVVTIGPVITRLVRDLFPMIENM
ncbi:MAG TPA: type II secretion system F family protein [Bryobacteraceae bacterium]|nr:type II secretion system F family protein [Bryobacteraceae bacterium]